MRTSTSQMQLHRVRRDDQKLGRWKYSRILNMDGNFKAEHMRMRHPENDIPIADGTGFVVGTQKYKTYLAATQEEKRVSEIGALSCLALTVSMCNLSKAHATTTKL